MQDKSSEDSTWMPMWWGNKKLSRTQSSHPTECICQCTVWPSECTAGERYHDNHTEEQNSDPLPIMSLTILTVKVNGPILNKKTTLEHPQIPHGHGGKNKNQHRPTIVDWPSVCQSQLKNTHTQQKLKSCLTSVTPPGGHSPPSFVGKPLSSPVVCDRVLVATLLAVDTPDGKRRNF